MSTKSVTQFFAILSLVVWAATFIIIMWAAFLARVRPVTRNAKPTCMKSTRKPVISVHIMLIAERFLPMPASMASELDAIASGSSFLGSSFL